MFHILKFISMLKSIRQLLLFKLFPQQIPNNAEKEDDDENQIFGPHGIRPYYDNPEDFKEGEVVTGQFVRLYQSHVWYALVDLDDGRKTRVSLKYFIPYGKAVYNLRQGDRLTLVRLQYSTKCHHSAWKVESLPFRARLQSDENQQIYQQLMKIGVLDNEPRSTR